MNFKPFSIVVCRKLMIDDVKAHCTYVRDQVLLPSEVHDEVNHYSKETFFNHFVHDVFHDKVKLMHFTPNMKEKTFVMHKILKSGHNTNITPGHISSFVKRQTKKANIPIRKKYC